MLSWQSHENNISFFLINFIGSMLKLIGELQIIGELRMEWKGGQNHPILILSLHYINTKPTCKVTLLGKRTKAIHSKKHIQSCTKQQLPMLFLFLYFLDNHPNMPNRFLLTTVNQFNQSQATVHLSDILLRTLMNKSKNSACCWFSCGNLN